MRRDRPKTRRLAAVMALRGSRCWYCGQGLSIECGSDLRRRACVDHFVATSRGGGEEEENLVPACGRCNSIKCSRSIDDARHALILARLAWPAFTAAQVDWLEASGFDVAPVRNGRLFFEDLALNSSVQA